MGVKRIWGLIGAFAGKRAANISNTNDLCSEELKRLQDELVREDVKPIPHVINTQINVEDPYNQPFTKKEFYSTLKKCKKNSAAGIDQISYEIIRKLPRDYLDIMFRIFNECFITGQYPEMWRRTLVKFIPKPGGKGTRPVSLTPSPGKIMERMINCRLEHFVESNDLIPVHQIGFRKERSAMECVIALASDILEGFTEGKGTVAVALDIKGAFNALLPAEVVGELERVNAPTRIINFVSFMITKRHLSFDDKSPSRE